MCATAVDITHSTRKARGGETKGTGEEEAWMRGWRSVAEAGGRREGKEAYSNSPVDSAQSDPNHCHGHQKHGSLLFRYGGLNFFE